jgi:hypothetical protein
MNCKVLAAIALSILLFGVPVRAAEPDKPAELTLQALIDSRTVVTKELNEAFQRFKKLESVYRQLDAEIERRQKAQADVKK